MECLKLPTSLVIQLYGDAVHCSLICACNEPRKWARVLLVGYDPETVDYSNPALPPGMSAEKIRAGIALTLKQMTDKGWESDLCFIRPDETAGQTVERHLASANYTCVVIGAGVRLPPQGLEVFEAVVNAVNRGAPGAAIAFNTRPEDSADAAARWMPHDPAHSK